MASLERQRMTHKFGGTVITNPEAQSLISILQFRQANPDKMRVRIEGKDDNGRYSYSVGRKATKGLLLKLSAYEGSTEMEMTVFVDKKPAKAKRPLLHETASISKPLQRVVLEEIVISNPSQTIIKKALEKKPSLGERVFIGELHNRKGHVVASVEIIPSKLEKTPEVLEDTICNLLQTDSLRIQDVLYL